MKKFFAVLLFLPPALAWSQVKPFMDQMFNQIFILKPFIVSEAAFKDPKNFETIDKALVNMVEASRKINHDEKIQRSGFQISAKVLTQQLNETEMVFKVGNKDYSMWMLKSTLGVCMNCHTQLPSVSTHLTTLNQAHILSNPFEEAEFLFVIRNFDEAMKLYRGALNGYPKNVVSVDSLEKAIYRQLFYYVRVKRDFPELIKVLDEDLKNAQLPRNLQKKLEGLKAAAVSMKTEPYPVFTGTQEGELRKHVEGKLQAELSGKFDFGSPRRELEYLKISSVLFEYLEQNPATPLKPDILYWLSFCESRYSHQLLYSMPELYLKQCVLEFPKNPVAKKCLTEYQDLVTMAYSGSGGTHVPPEVAKEIKVMQELVKTLK
jgi:tetratricopeptide (TPR) repeat protein